jgi:hypothetical protein
MSTENDKLQIFQKFLMDTLNDVLHPNDGYYESLVLDGLKFENSPDEIKVILPDNSVYKVTLVKINN